MKVQNGRYFKITDNQTDEYFRKVWAKEKGHKLHDLRHTFGTVQVCVNKVDIKTVSLWMGHSTINTTLRIYTHPEQLDKGTFLNCALSDEGKLAIYRHKYDEITTDIVQYIDGCTKNLPNF